MYQIRAWKNKEFTITANNAVKSKKKVEYLDKC